MCIIYLKSTTLLIMLLSFLSVLPATALKFKRKKAETKRLTRQARKLLCEERLKKYEATKPDKEVVEDLLEECVEAVFEMVADQAKLQLRRDEAKEEVNEARDPLLKKDKKRKR